MGNLPTTEGKACWIVQGAAEYDGSISSKKKSELIKKIAKVLNNLGANVRESGDNKEIVGDIVKYLKKNRAEGNRSQTEKVCNELAKVVNEELGEGAIDMNLSTDRKCERVAFYLKRAVQDLVSEVKMISLNTLDGLRNLELLLKYLDEVMKKHYDQLEKSKPLDIEVEQSEANAQKGYEIIREEIVNQIGLLKSLNESVLDPTTVELEAELKKVDDIYQYIDDIKTKPGKTHFADALNRILYGVGTSAWIANKIDNQLKKIGMSVAEYKQAQKSGRLMDEIAKIAMKNPSDDVMVALDQLVKLTGLRYDVNELLGQGEYHGGDDDYASKRLQYSLDKKIKKQKVVKKLELKVFVKNLKDLLNELDRRLMAVAKRIGKDIPITEELNGFRKTLDLIEPLSKGKDILALSSFYMDIGSVEIKETYVEKLRSLNSFVSTIRDMNEYSTSREHWEALHKTIDDLIKFIDGWADKMQKQRSSILGQAEDKDENEEWYYNNQNVGGKQHNNGCKCKDNCKCENKDNCKCECKCENVEGGQVLSEVVKNIMPEVNKTSLYFQEIKTKFDYYYRIANIRDNLKECVPELKRYAKNYNKVLGTALADEKFQLEKEFNEKLELIKNADGYIDQGGYKNDQNNAYTAAYNASINAATTVAAATTATTIAAATTAGNAAKNAVNKNNYNYEMDKRTKDLLTKLYTEQHKAKINMYRAIEAIDLYMKHFTEEIVANPDDIKNIKSMLDDVPIISDWYDNITGNNICRMFEYLPYDGDNNTSKFGKEEFDGNNANIQKFMKGSQADNVHYYDEVKNLGNSNIGNPEFYYSKLLEEAGYINYIQLNRQLDENIIGECPIHLIKNAKNKLKKSLSGFVLLKNLISIFTYIGDRFGNESLKNKIFMSPNEIYRALNDYILNSAFYINVLEQEGVNTILNQPGGPNNTMSQNAPTGGPNKNINNAKILKVEMYCRLVEKPISALGNNPVNPWNNNGKKDYLDHLFADTLKAMMAKVFTVIGVYDLFERPDAMENQSIGNLRMILGGADGLDVTPEIIEEAADLYVRLPLLAEFYKQLFATQADPGAGGKAQYFAPVAQIQKEQERFAMIPDVEGVFSGLIKTIWILNTDTMIGEYSLTEVRNIIKEINNIYRHFSGKSTRDIIYEFVKEVNRRYGLMNKSIYDKYVNDLKNLEYKQGFTGDVPELLEDNLVDYSILPGEDKYEIDRPAPSDRWFMDISRLSQKPASFVEKEKSFRYKLQQLNERIIYNFRNYMDSNFQKFYDDNSQPGRTNIPRRTFTTAIQGVKVALKKITNKEDRFDLILKLVQKLALYEDADKDKLLIFNETVVVGLNMLYIIYKHINNLRQSISVINLAPNPTHLTKNFINILFGYSSSECIINLRFVEIPQLDFSNLKNVVQQLLSSVKYFLNELRPYFNENFISLYEKFNPTNLLTVYSLEKAFNNLFMPTSEISVANQQNVNNWNLNLINKNIKEVYNKVKNGIPENFIVSIMADNLSATPINTYTGNYINNAFEGLLNDYDQKGIKQATYLNGQVNLPQIVDDNVITGHVSRYNMENVVGRINDLLVQYIDQFYDESSKKIYIGLINKLVNSQFNQNILNPLVGNYDIDIANAGNSTINFVENRLDVNDLSPIYQQTAFALKNLVSVRTVNRQSPIFLYESIAEVNEYMKEKYRMFLPIFHKSFMILEEKCKLIKKFWFNANIPNDLGLPSGDQGYKAKLATLVDQIIDLCNIMINTCKEVLNEVGDTGVYFELRKDFIKSYKEKYNKEPFMPLSNLLFAITTTKSATLLENYATSNINDLKYIYGIHCVNNYNNNISPEKFPYFFQMIRNYNNNLKQQNQLRSDHVNSFFNNILKLYQQFNMSTSKGLISMTSQFSLILLNTNIINNNNSIQSVELSQNYTSGILQLINNTENSFQEQSIDNVINKLLNQSGALGAPGPIPPLGGPPPAGTLRTTDIDNRIKAMVENIIDLDIVPINVHAMMREIPLANIYNYSYTFDKMTSELFGVKGPNNDKLIFSPFLYSNDDAGRQLLSNEIRNSSELFAASLINPYFTLTNNLLPLLDRIFIGRTKANLERPKFLSDQIYNKCLLQSLYPRDFIYFNIDEAGPNHLKPKNMLNILGEVVSAHLYSKMTTAAKNIIFNAFNKNNINVNEFNNIIQAYVNRLYKFSSNSIIDSSGTSIIKNEYIVLIIAFIIIYIYTGGYSPSEIEIKQIFNGSLAPDYINFTDIISGQTLTLLTMVANNKTELFNIAKFFKDTIEDQRYELSQTSYLKYISNKPNLISKNYYLTPTTFNNLQNIAQNRLNSMIIRNLLFITDAYRAMRAKLFKELTLDRGLIIKSNAIVNPDITEFHENETINNQRRKQFAKTKGIIDKRL